MFEYRFDPFGNTLNFKSNHSFSLNTYKLLNGNLKIIYLQ